MHWTRQFVLLILLGILLPSCASAPNALNETITVIELRQDYLRENPEGEYNQFIGRGQVIKGMKFKEVMASWGLPESRRLSRNREFEYWTFYGKDADSGNWMRYTLVFQKNTLTNWDVVRHYAKNGTLENWATRNWDPLIQTRYRVPVTDVSTVKR